MIHTQSGHLVPKASAVKVGEIVEDFFPDPESARPHEDKDILLGRIKAVADKMGMKASDRAKLWQAHCPGATPQTVDQAALADLYAALVALSGKK